MIFVSTTIKDIKSQLMQTQAKRQFKYKGFTKEELQADADKQLNVCIINLNAKTREQDLVFFCNQLVETPIDSSCVKIVRDLKTQDELVPTRSETQFSRGIAHVRFHTKEDASRVVSLDDPVLDDRHLRISLSNRSFLAC